MRTAFFQLDERAGDLSRKVCTLMYCITLLMLIGVLFYRQFVLNEDLKGLRDIANILVFNVILTPCIIGLWGGFSVRKVKPLVLLAVYVGFVLLGSAFTFIKYTVLLNQHLGTAAMLDKLLLISAICAGFVAVYVFFAYFGARRIDKEIG